MRKILVSIWLVVFMLSESESQQVSSNFSYYNFDHGLSSNEIQCLAQDQNGFLWIGTANGLNRYDGNSFIQYFKSAGGLSENSINDIVCLPHGILAIATGGGLSFFYTRTNTFSIFRSKDTSTLAAVSNNFQRLCVDQRGDLWADTQTDIYVFDSTLKLLKTFNSGFTGRDINRKLIAFAYTIGMLPDGNVMIHFPDHYSLYNPETSQLLDLTASANSPWSFVSEPDFTHSCLADPYGRFWFLKSGKDSLYRFDFQQNKSFAYFLFLHANQYYGSYTDIRSVDQNHILIQLPYSGFYELSLSNAGGQIMHLKGIPALAFPFCTLSDNLHDTPHEQNSFWIGTINGLYESSALKSQFKTIVIDSSRNDVDNNLISVLNDRLWIGSYGNGFYTFDPSAGHFIHYDLNFRRGDLRSLVWDIKYHNADTLWIGTQAGLIWFVEKTKSFGRLSFAHPSILDSFPITTQFEDSHGLIWMGIGNGHGVVCYNPAKNSFSVFNDHSVPEFPLRYPMAIAEDENQNLWMGTQKGGGLVEWDRKLNRFTLFPSKLSTPFSDDRISDIYTDHHGHIWIASQLNGLVCYDLATRNFESFGTEKGLSQESVYRIRVAQYPYLWLITGFGLDRFNMQTKTFESFYEKDGLPTNQLSEGIFYNPENGMMYVGYKKGFVEFDARSFLENSKTPNVLVTDLIVNDQPVRADLNQPIHLSYKQNDLSVTYTAVDLVNGSDLKFRYRLGNEVQWHDLGKTRQIHFSNLSPGDYSLRIEAANKSGTWSGKETSLNFFIQPPFWKTSWFYVIVALFLALIIYFLYRFRIRQIQKLQEMRNRIARDLHDDIGGTMTAMNLTNELAMQQLENPLIARKLLMSISEDLKNVGETLDDIVWTVNPRNDSMEEVMARMRRFASAAWETAGIDFSFEFDKNAEHIRLNMEQRHDLYLTFKEAVSNVAKHSQSTVASSSVQLKDHSLVIEVTDNGKGFDVNSPSHRNGLKNMQSRIQKWRGKISIHSSEENGTKVTFQMPITQKGD